MVVFKGPEGRKSVPHFLLEPLTIPNSIPTPCSSGHSSSHRRDRQGGCSQPPAQKKGWIGGHQSLRSSSVVPTWKGVMSSAVLERMQWCRLSSHRNRKLSRSQAAGSASVWHWNWATAETTAVWNARWSAHRGGSAERGGGKVKRHQGPWGCITRSRGSPTISPHQAQEGDPRKGGEEWKQVSTRGSRWIPSHKEIWCKSSLKVKLHFVSTWNIRKNIRRY